MQQSQKTASETEAESGACLHFEGEARIVQPELSHGCPEIFEFGRIDRKEAAENHRLHVAKPRKRRVGRSSFIGNGVADRTVGDRLDRGGEEAHFARAQFIDIRKASGPEDADPVEVVRCPGLHHLDLLSFPYRPIDHPDDDHDTQIKIIIGVNEERLERLGRVAGCGRRQSVNDVL